MHLAIFSIILLEVSDGPNECDQAALGIAASLYLLHVDAVKEKCPVLGPDIPMV